MTRLINGHDYGPIWVGSGTSGFYPQTSPYWHTRMWKRLCPIASSMHGVTYVAKTATSEDRLDPENGKSNMYLHEDGETPRDLAPDCIILNPFTGDGLNAVGLAGPSLERHLDTEYWQKHPHNFMISLMAIGKTRASRTAEITSMVRMIAKHKHKFVAASVAGQVNESCPNVGLKHERREFIAQAHEHCNIFHQELGWDCGIKTSVATDPETAFEIVEHEHCHFLSPSNTISWNTPGLGIHWERLFGIRIGPFAFSSSFGWTDTRESPLKKYGGGGLSGPLLLRPSLSLIRALREMGCNKHINGGGGIRFARDVRDYKLAGADSVSYSTGSWCGWRNKAVVDEAYCIFGYECE